MNARTETTRWNISVRLTRDEAYALINTLSRSGDDATFDLQMDLEQAWDTQNNMRQVEADYLAAH